MNCNEKNLGASLLERVDYINKRLKISNPLNKIPIFSGTTYEAYIEVYLVDINFPIYRLSNIRTKSSQETFIAKNDVEKDFFKRDPECRDALKVQHELLYDIAISGGDEKNHYKTFEKEIFDRAHPMMMTNEGILINGNTRMSAIRELYYSDPVKFVRYEKIPIALLPPSLTEKDIRKLELNLQINPDIHKDYPWISEAMDCRDQLYLGRNENDIEIEYKRRKTDISHPINLINQLSMADQFLEMYNRIGEYNILEKDQFALLEWYKWRNEHKNNINRVTLIDNYCFEVIKSNFEGYRESQKGDIYKEFKKMNRTFGNDSQMWDNYYKQCKIDYGVETADQSKDIEQVKEIKSSYDFLTENLINDTTRINNEDETKMIKIIKNKLNKNDKVEGTKFVETFQSIMGAAEENEKRNRSKNIINELVIESYNNIEDCIKRLEENSNDFVKLEETLPEIEKLGSKLNILTKIITEKFKK